MARVRARDDRQDNAKPSPTFADQLIPLFDIVWVRRQLELKGRALGDVRGGPQSPRCALMIERQIDSSPSEVSLSQISKRRAKK